ncbi:MAG: hypothetical protein KHZ62_03270 [Clostridiales bacterium]|nr:hypothetical protein [Clostridiales bacterium]
MSFADILLIVTLLLVIALAGMYFYQRKNYKKIAEAREFVENNKQVTSIFIIDKKWERPTEKNLPRMIYDKLPRSAKIRKMSIVKAKVGPQIATLICDKNIYDALTPKKTVKVELSGIYIVNIVGMNLADKKKKTIGEKLTVFLNNH